jgi:hypothetical protein
LKRENSSIIKRFLIEKQSPVTFSPAAEQGITVPFLPDVVESFFNLRGCLINEVA